VVRDQLGRELVEHRVDQARRALERVAQRREAGRARGELLPVARELEVGVDAIAQDVGEIVDVEAREVLRLVRGAEAAERPRERILVARVGAIAPNRGPSGSSSRPAMRSARPGSRPWRKRTTASTVSRYVSVCAAK